MSRNWMLSLAALSLLSSSCSEGPLASPDGIERPKPTEMTKPRGIIGHTEAHTVNFEWPQFVAADGSFMVRYRLRIWKGEYDQFNLPGDQNAVATLTLDGSDFSAFDSNVEYSLEIGSLLEYSTWYYYQVEGVADNARVPSSDEDTATTRSEYASFRIRNDTPDGAQKPSSPEYSPGGVGNVSPVTLRWAPFTDEEGDKILRYDVYLSIRGSGDVKKVASGIEQPIVSNVSVEKGMVYEWWVKAFDEHESETEHPKVWDFYVKP